MGIMSSDEIINFTGDNGVIEGGRGRKKTFVVFIPDIGCTTYYAPITP